MKFKLSIFSGLLLGVFMTAVMGCSQPNEEKGGEKNPVPQDLSSTLLLKDWQPKSIFKYPEETKIDRAKFSVIDMHAHDYAVTSQEVKERVEIMDRVGIEKSVVFTNAFGEKFDSIYTVYSEYPDRFLMYCGFDFSSYPEDGWETETIKELERCVSLGAKGIGEIHDKGNGLVDGLHPDDSRMNPVWDACAELNIPIALHMIDPLWMYEPMDSTNDGLMRSWTWKIRDTTDILGFYALLDVMENTIRNHPKNKFVIAHLGNLVFDLPRLGSLFEKYDNFWADISARFSEFSTIPRTSADFFNKYQDRLVYGTDYGWETWETNSVEGREPGHSPYGQKEPSLEDMFKMTFRVLETTDEHFYMTALLGYKWPLYGLGLDDATLKKIYHTNAMNILGK